MNNKDNNAKTTFSHRNHDKIKSYFVTMQQNYIVNNIVVTVNNIVYIVVNVNNIVYVLQCCS